MTLKLNTGENRREYLKFLKADRIQRLTQSANKYAELPPNIRAAIAKVAGVENVRLDALSAPDRRKLNVETRKLIAQLVKAHAIIAATDVTHGVES